MSLPLELLPARLAVCRLAAGDDVPPWAKSPVFSCVTRTAAELSIVCAEDAVPPEVRQERGWRALAVAGSLDFGLVGIVASLAAPLAAAKVPIFVVSTFDTDYVLVKEDRLEAAIGALVGAGHRLVAGA